jgi:hypothetical protein
LAQSGARLHANGLWFESTHGPQIMNSPEFWQYCIPPVQQILLVPMVLQLCPSAVIVGLPAGSLPLPSVPPPAVPPLAGPPPTRPPVPLPKLPPVPAAAPPVVPFDHPFALPHAHMGIETAKTLATAMACRASLSIDLSCAMRARIAESFMETK